VASVTELFPGKAIVQFTTTLYREDGFLFPRLLVLVVVMLRDRCGSDWHRGYPLGQPRSLTP
jgi:hypothetical protein